MRPSERVLDLPGASVLVFPDAESASRRAADLIASTIRETVGARGKAVSRPGDRRNARSRLFAASSACTDRVSYRSMESRLTTSTNTTRSTPPTRTAIIATCANTCSPTSTSPPTAPHVFDGTVPEAFVARHAAEFDGWIEAEGGLDLQLLGIGRNGHIGFNEPTDLTVEQASSLRSRLVDLHPITIVDAAKDFGGETRVIRRAITLGISTILSSRSVVILALGTSKGPVRGRGPDRPAITARCPASLLRTIPHKVTWLLDEPAAGLVAP